MWKVALCNLAWGLVAAGFVPLMVYAFLVHLEFYSSHIRRHRKALSGDWAAREVFRGTPWMDDYSGGKKAWFHIFRLPEENAFEDVELGACFALAHRMRRWVRRLAWAIPIGAGIVLACEIVDRIFGE